MLKAWLIKLVAEMVGAAIRAWFDELRRQRTVYKEEPTDEDFEVGRRFSDAIVSAYGLRPERQNPAESTSATPDDRMGRGEPSSPAGQ